MGGIGSGRPTNEQIISKTLSIQKQNPISTDFYLPNLSGTPEREKVKNIYHAYGGFQDKNETLTIANQNEWTFLTNATNNLFTGNETDGISLSGDIMTFKYGGDYFGNIAITLTGDLGQDFQLRVFNITQNKIMGYKIGVSTDGAGNFSNLATPLYLEINAGDQLRMEIQNISSDKDPTFKNCIFYIAYLHE